MQTCRQRPAQAGAGACLSPPACLWPPQGACDVDIEYGGQAPSPAAAALLGKVWAGALGLAAPQDVFGQLFAMAASYRKMESELGSQVTQVGGRQAPGLSLQPPLAGRPCLGGWAALLCWSRGPLASAPQLPASQ